MRLFFKIQNEFNIVFEHFFYFFGIAILLYHPAPLGHDLSESTPETCRGRRHRGHFLDIPGYHDTPQKWDG
jgi:hypothetical protein